MDSAGMWLTAILRRWIATRSKEIQWTVYGAAIGLVAGLLVGGVGIAALGGAVGLSAAVILSIVGALIGSRIGVERDRIAAERSATR